ncbi:acyl-CoA dehydrogenase family protein [Trujillonella endophytica]|uniref:Acyl-CoA dehydrogenase n=1 Tax=Trujillonella endophytica TaxID=673521 RepID=A0A1H8WM93_9ACTN|nr:acyl-CoA dehydrogenase family protein [Trujillella endophytica]SEP28746.1 acyl-CoA dehydrogenase [Trujillella endophytica]
MSAAVVSSAEDLAALRRSVRAFLADAVPEAEVRRLAETRTGFDPAVWARLAGELGLTGLVVPEEFGGSGAGFAALGVVLEEAGRALLPAPLFSTVVLGVHALLLSGDVAAQADHLPEIAAGRLRVAVGGLGTGPRARAIAGTRGWLLEGTVDGVLDGATADLLLVFADAEGGAGLFAVPSSAAGLSRTPLRTLDLTRRQARVELHATPAALVGAVGDGGRVSAALLDRALAALAAESVGGAQRVLEMAVEYAGTRYQFGRAIGSFQAVKHRCADMLIDVERMRVAAEAALGAVDAAAPDLPVAARVAASFCGEAYFAAAASGIQVHGGIGFTWEHPAHLYYRRAKSAELLFGSPAEHREALLRQLGH